MSEDAFNVLECPELGRYGVAAKNLQAGEIIFEEQPFAIGPKASSSPLCLECACPVDGGAGGPKCPQCGWPLCPDCVESVAYHKAECELFVKFKVKFQNVQDSDDCCAQLDCITPLRVLLAKEADPERWNADISVMEDHRAKRVGTVYWDADHNNIVRYLRLACGLKDRCSEELIQQVIGILEVNAFEARTHRGFAVRGLYPKLAIMAHSCIRNVVHSIHPSKNYRLIARTSVDVAEGAKLYTSYTFAQDPTHYRQTSLKDSKYFSCQCERCLDPTELGTYFSSLKCRKCNKGSMVSSKPTDEEAEWHCTSCDRVLEADAMAIVTKVMQDDVGKIVYVESGTERLESYEQAFAKYSAVLEPLHYLLNSIRQSLIELYGRVPEYRMQEMSDAQLERKIELCRDVKRVLDVFEPGKTRSRAILLYEMHAPIVVLSQSLLDQGKLDIEEMKIRFEEVVVMLEESAEILEWEDPVTPEGTLADLVKEAIVKLTL